MLASAIEMELSRMLALLSVLMESDCEAGAITTKSRNPNHRARQCAREGKSFSIDIKSCHIGGSAVPATRNGTSKLTRKIQFDSISAHLDQHRS